MIARLLRRAWWAARRRRRPHATHTWHRQFFSLAVDPPRPDPSASWFARWKADRNAERHRW